MTARFKKVHHVSLLNEPEPDDFEVQIELDCVNNNNEESGEPGAGRKNSRYENGSEDLNSLLPVTTGRIKWWREGWKVCKRKRQYRLYSSYAPTEKVCGHSCRLCRVNSWVAVFIALFVFSTAVVVSVLLSRLLAEPPVVMAQGVGAVSSDAAVCANMSANILRQGGSAVDAVITAMLCNGVVHAESSGLGGGGFMVVRLANGSVYSLIFRETAPSNASWDMYHSDRHLSLKGGLAVAVPGEVRGMEEAHKRFGRLEWKKLFEPVIQLCNVGYALTPHTVSSLDKVWDGLPSNIKNIYSSANGSRKELGELIKRPDLAETLEYIANFKSSAFYEDTNISRSIVKTVTDSGGIMTAEDLASYQVRIEEPAQASFCGHTFYSPHAPSGGPTLLFMLELLDLYSLNFNSDLNLTYHRLVESFKFAYSERTRLGDPHCDDALDQKCLQNSQQILQAQRNMLNNSFVWETWSRISDEETFSVPYYNPDYSAANDTGTSHISVVSPEGDAVAVTTTINTYFGSKLMTDTGIILNNEMDDFASPNITNEYNLRPSEANYIFPGKRPLSSTCPTIAVTNSDDGSSQLYLVLGGSGGSRITTAVAQVILLAVVFEESLKDAIETRRLHHQLLPDTLSYERGFSGSILEFLKGKGHKIKLSSFSSVIQGIKINQNGLVTAYADSRKDGLAVLVNSTSTA